jgi:hypothetical protein
MHIELQIHVWKKFRLIIIENKSLRYFSGEFCELLLIGNLHGYSEDYCWVLK